MAVALGASTSSIAIGTSVLTPTFRYHPGVVAQAFATLGCLYPGRVILGVGSGESLNEVALGIAWPDGKERFARLKEAIDLIRRYGARTGFARRAVLSHGPSHDLRPADVVRCRSTWPRRTRPRPGSPAESPMVSSRRQESRPSLYQDTLLPAVRDGAGRAGRTVDDLDLQIEVKVSFDPDRERALRETRNWAALALSSEEKTGVDDPVVMEELAARLPVERAASRWIVSSDPAEHVEQIESYIDMGFRHLVFHGPGDDQRRFLELYGREILPVLRSRHAGGAGGTRETPER